MSPSAPLTDYSTNAAAFIEQLHNAFPNRFNLQDQWREGDYQAGDRLGRLFVSLYRPDPELPQQAVVRTGAEAKVINVEVLLRIVFDAEGLNEMEAVRKADQLFWQEVLDMEQRVSLMACEDLDHFGFIHEFRIADQVDVRSYVPLKQRGLWVLDIPSTWLVRFMVNRQLDGTLIPLG